MKHRIRGILGLVFVFILAAAVPYWARAADTEQREPGPEANLIEELWQATGGELRISRHSETGLVRFLGTTTEAAIAQPSLVESGVTPDVAARSFLGEYGSIFGITNPEQQLALMTERTLDDGRSVVRYQQTYQDVPVLAGELIVQMKGVDNAVLAVNGEVLPDIDLDVSPAVSTETARTTALGVVAKGYELDASQLEASEPTLWVYSPRLLGGPGPDFSSLVWRLEVTSSQMLEIRELVLVDAHMGAVALHFNQVHAAKDRKTYDAGNTNSLPGVLRRSEGQGPYGDADVDSAHDYAGNTYDFFLNEHGRDSLDDAGMTLISTTDYCSPGDCPLANAFWNGEQMAYGDGYASADDVVGHELAHGVTQFTSGLFYYYQSGAINESLSDVWGEFVDLTNSGGNDAPGVRWQMGEDLTIGAIRNMANPPAFGDPDRIGSPNYWCDTPDSGGVHFNSGVNNKAAYLMVDGGTFNGQTISGLGISKVADVYYEVQSNLLTSGSNYADLYDALIQASITLGYAPAERQAIQNALLAVEMNEQPCGRPEPAPICAPGQTPMYVFSDDLENHTSGNWTKGTIAGSNLWYYPQNTHAYTGFDATYASSGEYNMWGDNLDATADSFIATSQSYQIPANAYLHFHHDWSFEGFGASMYDGGVMEYSTNGGGSWNDAGALFSENGYNGTISDVFGNPLGGRQGFGGVSFGYTASRLDLSSLAGDDVRFRFRIGTDSSIGDWGWFIDDIRIYSCAEGGGGAFDPDVLLPVFLR